MKSQLTQERLKELLEYSPDSGVFRWKIAISKRVRVNDVAGSLKHQSGYIVIGIDRRIYRSHRLAWLYVYGQWPLHHIDHINGNRIDNRIENLRDVSHAINCENLKEAPITNKSSGVLGVSRQKGRKKWRAIITSNKKQIHLGFFDSVEDAHEAYIVAKRKLHLGCTI